jgi:hypothetical protein
MASTEADREPRVGKKGYTEPKGRPTTHNTGVGRSKRISPMVEWLLVGIVFVAVMAGLFYFGRSLNSGGSGAIEAPAAFVAPDVAID